MARLPNCEQATLDILKLENYCLNPQHTRGRHKARVFRESLGLTRGDSSWLKVSLLAAVTNAEAVKLGSDAFGTRWRVDAPVSRHGKHVVLRTVWIVRTGENAPRF